MPFDGSENPVVKRLQSAKQHLIVKGWCQGVGRDYTGSICLAVAIIDADGGHYSIEPALAAVRKILGGVAINCYNDTNGRTLADVLDVLDQAATNVARAGTDL